MGDVFLTEMLGELAHRDVQSGCRRDPTLVDGVLVLAVQRHQVALEGEIREVEGGNPASGRDGRVARPAETLRNRLEVGDRGCLVEASDAHIDGMDGTPAEQVEDVVADLLQLEAAFDDVAVIPREIDGALVAEEVGRVEQIDVERMALDPLPAVEEAPQRPHLSVDADAGRVLDRLASAHLVGNRADAADAGGDVGNLAVRPAAQECLEEARRLEDAQLDIAHLAVTHHHVHAALALDAGQRGDRESARTGVGSVIGPPRRPRPPCSPRGTPARRR